MKYLTEKEFARIHDVNTRTLHYYDDIKLFSPKYKGKNGYRYYTYMQGEEFQLIMALRELSMSIEEIKSFLERKNSDNLESMLSRKSMEIDAKIKQLKQIKEILEDKKSKLSTVRTADLNQIDIVSCKTEYLFLTKANEEVVLDEEIMDQITSLNKAGGINRIYNANYGAMISVDSLSKGKCDNYSYYFIRIKNSKSKKGLHKKEGGPYLRAYCVGEWNKLPETYQRILKYAEENKLKLSGYAYEQGINEMAITDMSEYVTEILIKCETTD